MVSAEPVYRAGRRIGIRQLWLRPGATVVDIGCGTGLNFALLEEAIGPTGRIVAVDLSDDMLAAARRRTQKYGWDNVELLQVDATTVTPRTFTDRASSPDEEMSGLTVLLSSDRISLWAAPRRLPRTPFTSQQHPACS